MKLGSVSLQPSRFLHDCIHWLFQQTAFQVEYLLFKALVSHHWSQPVNFPDLLMLLLSTQWRKKRKTVQVNISSCVAFHASNSHRSDSFALPGHCSDSMWLNRCELWPSCACGKITLYSSAVTGLALVTRWAAAVTQMCRQPLCSASCLCLRSLTTQLHYDLRQERFGMVLCLMMILEILHQPAGGASHVSMTVSWEKKRYFQIFDKEQLVIDRCCH